MKPVPFARPLACVAACISLLLTAATHAASGAEPSVKGVRTLILVRHGVYDEADPRDPEAGRNLTELGRAQARATAHRLAGSVARVDVLRASSMTRARETAAILGDSLHLVPVIDRDLREGTPPTIREDVMLQAGDADSTGQRLERALGRYFRVSPGRDSVEVIVAHGNVIRWFACRALGVDPRLWLNMGTTNCGLTVIEVRPDGKLRLVSYNDTGHLTGTLLPRTEWYKRASGDSPMGNDRGPGR